jgi:branched-chain amino acid transport system permease protein
VTESGGLTSIDRDPTGLGDEGESASSLVSRMSNRQPPRLAVRALPLVAFVVVALAFRGFASNYWLSLCDLAFIAAIGAIALNLLTGFAGQISIGSAAFMAIGAWTSVIVHGHVGFGGSVLIGGIVAGVIGFVAGLPSLRLRGLYLTLATLALQEIVVFAFNRYSVDQQAYAGYFLPHPSLGFTSLDTDGKWYYLLLGALVVTAVVCGLLVSGKPGRAWIAIREHSAAAALVGVNVTRYKLYAFTLSSFIIGVQGALSGYYIQSVGPDNYTLLLAISYVAMIILGGLGSLSGSVVGAFVVTLLPFGIANLAHSLSGSSASPTGFLTENIPNFQTIAYGLLVLAFLYFEPRGIAGLFKRVTLLTTRRGRSETRGN